VAAQIVSQSRVPDLFSLSVGFSRAQNHLCQAAEVSNLHPAIAKSQQDRSERDYIGVVETVFTGAFVLPLGGWHCPYGGQVAQPSPPVELWHLGTAPPVPIGRRCQPRWQRHPLGVEIAGELAVQLPMLGHQLNFGAERDRIADPFEIGSGAFERPA
jgi:hypothetical protein